MPARFFLARKKALELLESGHIKKAPVPVEKLATSLKAKLRYEPYAGHLSGVLHRRNDGSSVIGVNSLHANTRRRFTIAHELGHLLLHKNEMLHVDSKFPIALRSELSSLAVDELEIEANQFAAELLMPTELLNKDIARIRDDIEIEDAVGKLADKYQVSVQAMTIRLSTLKVIS